MFWFSVGSVPKVLTTPRIKTFCDNLRRAKKRSFLFWQGLWPWNSFWVRSSEEVGTGIKRAGICIFDYFSKKPFSAPSGQAHGVDTEPHFVKIIQNKKKRRKENRKKKAKEEEVNVVRKFKFLRWLKEIKYLWKKSWRINRSLVY